MLVLLAAAAATEPTQHRVLLLGATGRTGFFAYQRLQASPVFSGRVNALVTNISKAQEVLGCIRCDASEGVYLGNVTNMTTLGPALAGVDTVVSTVGAYYMSSPPLIRAVEFGGVQNVVRALTKEGSLSALRFVLLSSMGTTTADADYPSILFWKINAEVRRPRFAALHSVWMLMFDLVPQFLSHTTGLPDGERRAQRHCQAMRTSHDLHRQQHAASVRESNARMQKTRTSFQTFHILPHLAARSTRLPTHACLPKPSQTSPNLPKLSQTSQCVSPPWQARRPRRHPALHKPSSGLSRRRRFRAGRCGGGARGDAAV